jgi:tyrosyl-tRNA synthetase
MAERIDTILKKLERTADQYFSKEELKAKLKSGKPLRIKYSVDVTSPVLHIGHAVNLWMLRYLQSLGHKVVFLIGDFTARIGDPDERMETRPVIPRKQIEKHVKDFIDQAKMVLRFDDPNLIEVRRNSEWYDKMPVPELLNLLSMVTHARMISRDMFQMRIAQQKEIHMHELVYPVLQGYDSVMVKSDLAIIGSDQLFNENIGRFFQEKFKQKPQTIVTTVLTPGIDGRGKQSKSVGNYIGLAHSPRDKFGRVMSIPDDLIDTYFRVYTDVPTDEIDRMADDIAKNPRDAKVKLAYAIVGRYHGHQVAVWEREWFENTVSKGLVPEDIPTLPVQNPRLSVVELVALAKRGRSRSEARRLIEQGAVELNKEKKKDPKESLLLQTNDILRVGKRNWYRIEIVRPNEFDTDGLEFKIMQIDDLDLVSKYLPDWELAKYLSLPLGTQKEAQKIAREVIKRVVMQPEPKNQFIWKIQDKNNPDKTIGVAHLGLDDKGAVRHNVWLDPTAVNNDMLMQEAVNAINEFAFQSLGLQGAVLQKAFALASAPTELSQLQARFLALDASVRNRDMPTGGAMWGITRDGWEDMKSWWNKYKPQQNTPVAGQTPQPTPQQKQEKFLEKEKADKKLQQEKKRLKQELDKKLKPPTPQPS